MLAAMPPPVMVPLRKVNRPGKKSVWDLEVSQDAAVLRDRAGQERETYTPVDAALGWRFPSLVWNVKYFRVNTRPRVSKFECDGRALGALREFALRGVNSGDPAVLAQFRSWAATQFAIGGVLLVICAFATFVSLARSARTGGGGLIVFGPVFPSLFFFARGTYLWLKLGALRRAARRRPVRATAKVAIGPVRAGAAVPAPAPRPPAASPTRITPAPAASPRVRNAPVSSAVKLPSPRRGARPSTILVRVLLALFVLAIVPAVLSVLIWRPWKMENQVQPGGLAQRAVAIPQERAHDVTPPPRPIASEVGNTGAAEPIPVIRAPAVHRETPRDISALITFTDGIKPIEPPASVRAGALVSGETAVIFYETARRSLTAPLRCDATAPGRFVMGGARSPGQIAAGTTVNCFFIHANTSGKVAHLTGSVTFPTEILGIIVDAHDLDASDGVLGRPGVSYPTGGKFRGFFDGDHDDEITVSRDRRTLSFTSHTGKWVDQVRVITAAK